MEDNTQVQTQLTALRNLQQSYDALATASASGATAAALENAKQAILNAIAAIDMSDLAKEATLNSVGLDVAAAKTAAQSITGYALQGSDSTATNTVILAKLLEMDDYLLHSAAIVANSDNVGTSNQGYTIVLDQTQSVNGDTLNI